jgi:hypothetical protein
MGIKGTTWNRMISALKNFANLSASSRAFFANAEPSNGTKILLYILPTSLRICLNDLYQVCFSKATEKSYGKGTGEKIKIKFSNNDGCNY